MKKLFLILVLFTVCISNAQENNTKPSIEDKIIGVQLGLFGFWTHYEPKLSPSISLRTEIGFEFGLRKGILTNDDLVFALIPNIVLEPRWYYSLNRRAQKGRQIDENSGFFLGFKTRYYPDWFILSNDKNVSVIENIEFIPKIGYRKVWNKHLTFESGFGIGKSLGLEGSDVWDTTAELTFRVGYNFN
jgi:hypothetical protein